MSVYFKMYNALITGNDPDTYTPEPPMVIARMASGKPIAQGREAGTLTWGNMSVAAWIDLWDKWNTGKNGTGTFVIPPRTSGQSWSSWRSVTAYAEEPTHTATGLTYTNVSMRIVIP